LASGHAEHRRANWATLAVAESTVAGRVQHETEALEVHLQPSHHVVCRPRCRWAPDAGKEAFVDRVVFPFADLYGERDVVLAGATEYVKVEEQIARLKGSHLGATAVTHSGEPTAATHSGDLGRLRVREESSCKATTLP
jgi:hypothetical protein